MTFEHEGVVRAGARVAEGLVDLNATDDSLPASVRELLELGPNALAAAARAVAAAGRVERARDEVTLKAPIPNPGKILCIGLNYRDHAAESNSPLPEKPLVFAKLSNTVAGPDDPIVIPRADETVDYEAELGVVIGRTARRVALDEASAYVAGYLNVHDVSARTLQLQRGQFLMGKSPDGFAPMGPELVTADEVLDPHVLKVQTRVNGVTRQDGNTSDLIFNVHELIADITSVITLEPGDVIATGTPAGIGFARTPPVYLTPGDVVEIEVEGLGVLSNPVVAEA